MSDISNNRPDDAPATQPTESQTPDAKMPDTQPVHAEAATPDPLAVLEAEKADLKDKLLRTLADMENLRRRTEREVSDARIYGVTKFARDMLDVADNLRRALESLPAEVRERLDPAARGVIEGVELTEKELLKRLDLHGVRKLDPLGQKFDPNMHQAMFEAPDPAHPKGHVVAVVQAGYSIGERVLRPALVGVSSGAPKVDAPAGADGPANG